MASNKTFLYWDACVFSSYIGQHPNRVDTIATIWELVRQNPRKIIITSSISILEVSFASGHGTGVRDPQKERIIDDLWRDSKIQIIDASQDLMYQARSLMRDAKDKGWSLKPNDALHLVSAQWINDFVGDVLEVHTYDKAWEKMSPIIGGLKICEPYVIQPHLIKGYGQSDDKEDDSLHG